MIATKRALPRRTFLRGAAAAIGLPLLDAMIPAFSSDAPPIKRLGFVYLPAFAGIVATTVLTAPLGAAGAHRTPGKRLRQIFAVLLYALATRMLIALL